MITLTRRQIFDYISVAKQNGMSQAQIDDSAYINKTDNLLLRYLGNLLGKTVDKKTTPTIQTRKRKNHYKY